MIGTISIKVNAARPNFPLQPMFAFQGSPSSIRVLEVPKKIGDWNITNVKVVAQYPDNTTVEKVAVRTGSVWVATFDGCEIAGKVGNGLSILADGIDEDGNEVSGYVLGKGDVFILENDTDVSRLVDKIAVRYIDDIPDVPTKGDLMNSNGELRLFDGEDWIVISTTEPPPVYDSQITIKKNGTPVGTFTVNADQPKAIDIPVPSRTTDIENDSGFITVAAIPSTISSFDNDVGYITASALPTKVSELENDVGYITEEAIPSNVTAFNNDAGYITQEAIPSQVSSFENDSGYITASALPTKVSELENDSGYITESAIPSNVGAFQNDVGYLTSVSWGEVQDKPDVALMSDIPSNVGELENDAGYITASAIPSQVSAFENDVGYLSAVSWGQVQDKPDVALVSQIPTTTASLTNDSGFITLSAIPSNVGAFANDVGYLTSTSTAFTAKRDKTDLTYEYHYNQDEYWNIPRWVVVYDGSTFNLDKYDSEKLEWTDGSGVWSVKVDFAGMGATPYFTLFHQTTGVLAMTPTEGAGSTTWNFTLLGESGTVEMDMDGTLTTVDAVEKIVDEKILQKRDYSDITYYATSETYSAYTHGISTFTIATTWDNIGEQTTNAPTVSASTTTWALDNGLGVLTADGSTFYFQQSGSAVGSSFTMDELKAGAVRRVFDLGGYEGINVTANANFFKTEFALKDALPSKTSDLVNDSGFITESAVPSKVSQLLNDEGYITSADIPPIPYATSDLVNDSGFITASAIPSNVGAFNNDAGYITASAIPPIPSNTSDLVNDSGFITASAIPSNVGSFTNDVGYITASAIPSSYSFISDVNENVINADRTISYPDNYCWNIIFGTYPTAQMSGTKTNSSCQIQTAKYVLTFDNNTWTLTQYFGNVAISTYVDHGPETATTLNLVSSTQQTLTVKWLPSTIVNDTLATKTQVDAKRDYADLTYPGSVYPSETYGIREFTLRVVGGLNPSTYTLNKFDSDSDSRWKDDEEYWNYAVTTSNGENFAFGKFGGSEPVTTFTMEQVQAGAVAFTMEDSQTTYSCTLNCSMYETTLALKDYVDAKIAELLALIQGQ